MQWKNKGHEFELVSHKILNKDCHYIIWGAGTFGEAFYKDFCSEIEIIAFVDSDPDKQNAEKCGCPVLSPDILKNNKSRIVLVSTGWTKEVFSELELMGYLKWETYFHIDEFITLYRMYNDNKLCVSNLNINITEFCSLRCRNCSALNPYIKHKKNYSKEEIKQGLDSYFKWVDNVSVLGIIGGDAMVHPQFNEILEMIGEHYYKKYVNNLEVYSNAILIPNSKSLELFKKYDVIYRFTDYGKNTFGKQKCEVITHILQKNNLRYDWAKFVKWYDCGYPQESNRFQNEEEWRALYAACDRRSCQGLMGTRLFYCGMAIGADRTQYCRAEKDDFFELNQLNINKMELMEFMLGFNEKGYIEYCKKCNGGPNVNKFFIEPGVQIK